MQSDKQLDEAIDRAVRELMSLDPPAGLRARVLSRLERPRPPLWSIPRVAAYAGVAAAVLLFALVVSRRESDHPPDTHVAGTPTASPRPSSARPPRPLVEPAPVTHQPRARTERTLPGEPRLEDRPLAAASLPPESSIDPVLLQPLSTIEVSRIEPAPIQTGEIAVTLLPPIPPVEIESLPPPGGGN